MVWSRKTQLILDALIIQGPLDGDLRSLQDQRVGEFNVLAAVSRDRDGYLVRRLSPAGHIGRGVLQR